MFGRNTPPDKEQVVLSLKQQNKRLKQQQAVDAFPYSSVNKVFDWYFSHGDCIYRNVPKYRSY